MSDFYERTWSGHDTGAPVRVEERKAFVDWLCTPASEREPKTLKAFGELHNVTHTTLHRWKADPRLQRAVHERMGHTVNIGSLPEVLATLHVQATNPKNPRSVQAARILIDYSLKTSEEKPSIDVRNLSNEEIRDMLLEAVDELDSRDAKDKASHHK